MNIGYRDNPFNLMGIGREYFRSIKIVFEQIMYSSNTYNIYTIIQNFNNQNIFKIIQWNIWDFDAPVPVGVELKQKDFFQDPATPVMEGIIDLHHDLMFCLIGILIFVSWLLLITIWLYRWNRGYFTWYFYDFFEYFKTYQVRSMFKTHHTVLEFIWTIIPSLILMFIALPSFALLYAMDEVLLPDITVKAVGHQWYWSYEYTDYVNINLRHPETLRKLYRIKLKLFYSFDSYMVKEEDLDQINIDKINSLFDNNSSNKDLNIMLFPSSTRFYRLLEVDNRVVLPLRQRVRFLVTSEDVIHSWAVPSLGIKVDACPGRLNQTSIYIKREGIFYGQCSEICGVNHAFMPIVVICVGDYTVDPRVFLYHPFAWELLTFKKMRRHVEELVYYRYLKNLVNKYYLSSPKQRAALYSMPNKDFLQWVQRFVNTPYKERQFNSVAQIAQKDPLWKKIEYYGLRWNHFKNIDNMPIGSGMSFGTRYHEETFWKWILKHGISKNGKSEFVKITKFKLFKKINK